MRESDFLAEYRQKIPNRLAVRGRGDEMAPEPYSLSEAPFIAQRLHIADLMDDPETFMKAQAVEDYIASVMGKEGLRDGTTGYNTVLERLLQRYPETFERSVAQGESRKLLDFLFKEVAIQNKMSSKTFLNVTARSEKNKRTIQLMSQLKAGLAAL